MRGSQIILSADILKKSYIILVLLLIAVWFLLSVIRLGYNYVRAFSSEREWLLMDDGEKRVRLLGYEHILLSRIEKRTMPTDSILFVLQDVQFSPGFAYKAIYYLYPRRLEFDTGKEDFVDFSNSYSNIIFFGNKQMGISKILGEKYELDDRIRVDVLEMNSYKRK